MESQAIKISGVLTKDEVTESFWRFRRQRVLVFPILTTSIVSIFFSICISIGVTGRFLMLSGIWPYVGLVVGCVLLVGIPIFAVKLYLWVERTSFYYDTNQFFRDPVSYHIGETGIAVEGHEVAHLYTWKELPEVYETPAIFIVVVNKDHVLPIPKRLCTGPDQVTKVTKILRGGIKEYSILKGIKAAINYSGAPVNG